MDVRVYDSSETLLRSGTGKCELCTSLSAGTYDKIAFGDANEFASNNLRLKFDQFQHGSPLPPESPTGLSGTVDYSNAENGITEALVTLTWQISSNDPDQDNGEFDYRVYEDSILIQTDATETDSDGFREITIGYSQAGNLGEKTYHITAYEPVSALESGDSCSITLDLDVQSFFSDCGNGGSPTIAPVANPGTGESYFGDEGLLYGGDKDELADSFQISKGALDVIYGFIWLMVFAGAGFVATKHLFGAIGGGLAGIAWNIAFSLWPVWLFIFLIAIGGALFLLMQRRAA